LETTDDIPCTKLGVIPKVACVAGGIREGASGRATIIFRGGEAASEIPACHISYGFCLPPTFITFDDPIK